jgi:ATP-binding cassette subfamily C (CFTR/MRP) protein 1
LSYSLSFTGIIQIVVKYFVEVDNSMSSTERLYQYTTSLAQEAPLEGTPVRKTWPEFGAIKYEAVQMRYRPELPLVIDDFSLEIAGGERIGIVGRTGAGKSTILSTLFRLTEISGECITINDINIRQLGLHRTPPYFGVQFARISILSTSTPTLSYGTFYGRLISTQIPVLHLKRRLRKRAATR